MRLTHYWQPSSSDCATVDYDGSAGKGSIRIASSRNEGLERSFTLAVSNSEKTIKVKVIQQGRREEFLVDDAAFVTKDGQQFITIRDGL